MAKNKTQLKELMKKLQTLAERGVGGEKESAKKKLDKLLAANGMTENDLKADEVQYYLFSYNGEVKRRLLGQCIYKTLGPDNSKMYHTKGTRNKLGAYCTPAQKLEIELDFDFYSKLLDEEIDTLLTAFIAKQDLYPENSPTEVKNLSDLTEEEIRQWQKIQQYENNISKRVRAAGFLEDNKK